MTAKIHKWSTQKLQKQDSNTIVFFFKSDTPYQVYVLQVDKSWSIKVCVEVLKETGRIQQMLNGTWKSDHLYVDHLLEL